MAVAKKNTAKKGKGKRLIVDLPEELHRALKIKAAADGISIRDFVIAMLKEKGLG